MSILHPLRWRFPVGHEIVAPILFHAHFSLTTLSLPGIFWMMCSKWSGSLQIFVHAPRALPSAPRRGNHNPPLPTIPLPSLPLNRWCKIPHPGNMTSQLPPTTQTSHRQWHPTSLLNNLHGLRARWQHLPLLPMVGSPKSLRNSNRTSIYCLSGKLPRTGRRCDSRTLGFNNNWQLSKLKQSKFPRSPRKSRP